jgi:hypothetical protein
MLGLDAGISAGKLPIPGTPTQLSSIVNSRPIVVARTGAKISTHTHVTYCRPTFTG